MCIRDSVAGGLGLGVGKYLSLQLLFPLQLRFQRFQFAAGLAHFLIGGIKDVYKRQQVDYHCAHLAHRTRYAGHKDPEWHLDKAYVPLFLLSLIHISFPNWTFII